MKSTSGRNVGDDTRHGRRPPARYGLAVALLVALTAGTLTGCRSDHPASATGEAPATGASADSGSKGESSSDAASSLGSEGASASPEPTTSATTTSTTTTTTAPPPLPAPPPPVPGPAPAGPTLRQGDDNPAVADLEARLAALGYRPGAVDGRYDSRTASAVMAFQKREGLSRDGVAGPVTLAQVAQPTGAGPRDLSGPRIEVDLDRQVLFAVNGDGTFTTVNISSGSGKTYGVPGGGSARAVTPVGAFAIDRKIDGNRVAPLGTLYRPMYFKGGFAVHGSPSVPGFPASHGCVRTANVDQDFLFPLFAIGTPVVLYSGDASAPGAADIDPNVDPGG
jgi:peptidoglycan hydrolase-like protein with peptidoglycan-binding domain